MSYQFQDLNIITSIPKTIALLLTEIVGTKAYNAQAAIEWKNKFLEKMAQFSVVLSPRYRVLVACHFINKIIHNNVNVSVMKYPIQPFTSFTVRWSNNKVLGVIAIHILDNSVGVSKQL